jgi:hypothetical protein
MAAERRAYPKLLSTAKNIFKWIFYNVKIVYILIKII